MNQDDKFVSEVEHKADEFDVWAKETYKKFDGMLKSAQPIDR